MSKEILFEVQDCSKHFGPTIALNHVNFKVMRGEITGLIGENGSGKSTLSAIITGIHSKNGGKMFFKGEPWEPKTMIWSMNNGIGIIVQEKGTIPNISISENIFLGEADKFRLFKGKDKPKCPVLNKDTNTWFVNNIDTKINLDNSTKEHFIIDKDTNTWVIEGKSTQYKVMMQAGKPFGPVMKSKMDKAANEVLKEMGETKMNGSMPINLINFQDQKLIEIAKVVAKKPEILIVDETSTALSQHGREILYKLIHKMRDENKAVIFISHDLDEIMEQCDSLTVLRDGNIIRTFEKNKGEYDEDKIKESMIGRELKGDYYRSDFDGKSGSEVVLEMKHGVIPHLFKNFNIKLHKGEILGIGGLSECGMHQVGKALFGAIPLEAGTVMRYKLVKDKDTGEEQLKGFAISNPEKAIKNSIGYVSKNRDLESLNLNAPIKDNISIANLDKIAVGKTIILNKKENAYVTDQANKLSIKCASVDEYVSSLSGGNKQKVAFAKWIGKDCDILILDCPTRGVDIGVKQAMYQLIYDLKKKGKSIVMISEELAELIGMSDRIAIMKDGKLSKEFNRSKDLSESEIIKYMI
ncbi:MAG: sugar ABC transporter ATP-binding protein [Bacilli bacterium]